MDSRKREEQQGKAAGAAQVPSLKGPLLFVAAYPALTCRARIVPPCGLGFLPCALLAKLGWGGIIGPSSECFTGSKAARARCARIDQLPPAIAASRCTRLRCGPRGLSRGQ